MRILALGRRLIGRGKAERAAGGERSGEEAGGGRWGGA